MSGSTGQAPDGHDRRTPRGPDSGGDEHAADVAEPASTARRVRGLLRGAGRREAIVLTEVLGAPVSQRPSTGGQSVRGSSDSAGSTGGTSS